MTLSMVFLGDQLLGIGICLLLGIVAGLLRWVGKEALPGVARLLVYVMLPLSIIGELPPVDPIAQAQINAGLLTLVGGCAALIVLLVMVGLATAKLGRLGGGEARAHAVLLGFGAQSALGAPLVASLLGMQSNQALSVYLLVEQVLLWTLGFMMLFGAGAKATKGGAGNTAQGALRLPVPVMLALLACVPIYMGLIPEIPYFDKALGALGSLGGATKYLSALYLGIAATQVQWPKAIKRGSIWLAVAVKMLLLPLAVFMIARFTGLFSASEPQLFALMTMLPALTMLPAIYQVLGAQEEHATAYTLISTLLCVGTLPAAIYLVNHLPGA